MSGEMSSVNSIGTISLPFSFLFFSALIVLSCVRCAYSDVLSVLYVRGMFPGSVCVRIVSMLLPSLVGVAGRGGVLTFCNTDRDQAWAHSLFLTVYCLPNTYSDFNNTVLSGLVMSLIQSESSQGVGSVETTLLLI